MKNFKRFLATILFLNYFLQLSFYAAGFYQTTLVQTPRGLVPIETVESKDIIYSYDFLSKVVCAQTIKYTIATPSKKLVAVQLPDEILLVAPDQQFYLADLQKWVRADALKKDALLFSPSGKTVTVGSVTSKELEKEEFFYDFTIEPTHNFLVSRHSILTHNWIFFFPTITWVFGQGVVGLTWSALFAAFGAMFIREAVNRAAGREVLSENVNCVDQWVKNKIDNAQQLPKVPASYHIELNQQRETNQSNENNNKKKEQEPKEDPEKDPEKEKKKRRPPLIDLISDDNENEKTNTATSESSSKDAEKIEKCECESGTKGGAEINGRRYTKHALERMAPNSPENDSKIYTEYLEKGKDPEQYQQPRNIPPSVVEDAIQNGVRTAGKEPGTWEIDHENCKVLINDNGDVITVWRKK